MIEKHKIMQIQWKAKCIFWGILMIFVSLWICFMFSTVKYSAMAQKDESEAMSRPMEPLASVKKLEEQKRYYIAWEEYRQILGKEPGNAGAQEGLERLKRIFPYGSPNPIKDADIFTSQKITMSTYLLNTGEQISGISVEETAEIIRVQGKNGEVALNKSMIVGIFQKEVSSSTVFSPDVRYKSKADTISEDDADGHFLLSIFCMVNGLTEQTTLEYQKATSLDQRYSLLFRSVKLQHLFDMGMAKLHAGSVSSAKQYFETCAQEGRGTEIEAKALKKIVECNEQMVILHEAEAKSVYEIGLNEFNARSYEKSISLFQKVIQEYGKTDSAKGAQKMLEEAKKEIKIPFNWATLHHLEEYLNIPEKWAKSKPYIRGKIIIVDAVEKRVHRFLAGGGGIMSELVATKPEEVETVVLIKADSVCVGYYKPIGENAPKGGGFWWGGFYEPSRGSAVVENWTVTIIDKSERVIVEQKIFHGPSPPAEIRSSYPNAGYNSDPGGEVVDYILTLPRKLSSGQSLIVGKIKGVEPLIVALKDGNSSVRQAAVWALSELKDPRAVESLIAALKDVSLSVRVAAAEALGELKDPRAVGPLIAALKNVVNDVQERPVVEALRKITGEDFSSSQLWRVWWESKTKGGPGLYLANPQIQQSLVDGQQQNLSAKSQLPTFKWELTGSNEVRIRNPNDFAVTVGVRSGDKGKDFEVPPNGVASVFIPDGRHDIYFVYSNKPDALFQGDSFTLAGNGVEIQIVKVVGGNYGIRQVK